MPPIKAVIFDLDGTLVNFKLDYMTVRAEVKRLLTSYGFPPSIFSINESVFEMLKKMEIFMRNSGKNEREIEDIRREVLEIADKYELEAARNTSPISGGIEVLNQLKKMGLKIGLFTINGSKATSHILRSFRLKRFFDAIVTREDVGKVKPDAMHLEAVLNKLGVKPENTLVVGDSIVDMESARTLGAFAVGVITGLSSPEELIKAGAMCIITSLTDLPRLITELNKNSNSF